MNQRGENDLLETAYRDLDRTEFRAELIFVVLVIGAITILWSLI